MTRILLTGGAGFIGSAVCRRFMSNSGGEILVFDKLTYAGNLASLAPVADNQRFSPERGRISERNRRRSSRPLRFFRRPLERSPKPQLALASVFCKQIVRKERV